MSEFVEWFFTALSELRWLRRTVFVLLFGTMLYTSWWNWQLFAFLGVVWFLMELPDLVGSAWRWRR